jgi:transcriptional regulator with XRE-family HTH domain
VRYAVAKPGITSFDREYRTMARNYILQVLEKHDWTKADLARKAHVAASTFTRTVENNYSTHITPKVLVKVAHASNVPLPKELVCWVGDVEQKLDELPSSSDRTNGVNNNDELFSSCRDVPLYTLLPSELSNGLYRTVKIGYTERPNLLVGIEGVKALIVPDDSMSPVFAVNHIVQTNPDKTPRPNDDIVLELNSGHVAIRRLIQIEGKKVVVAHYSPQFTLSRYDMSQVRRMEPIAAIIRP